MKISLMKFIDEYAGRIILPVLIFFARLKQSETTKEIKARNILLIKFWGIGSIILTKPAIMRLREAYPAHKIFYVTLEENAEACREFASVEGIISISISSLPAFVRSLISAFSQLRSMHFNIVIDFEFYTYFSAVITALTQSKIKAGFDNSVGKRRIVYTNPVMFDNSIHASQNFLNLVSAVSAEPFPQRKSIVFPANGHNSSSADFVVMNVNASRLAYERRLPPNYFVKIADMILYDLKLKIKFIGTKDEANYVENVYGFFSENINAENLCGKTSVAQLKSLISKSLCVITNDSGPLHIASYLNIPSVSFFGPESPVRYGPLSKSNLVFYKNLKCSPCMTVSNAKTVNCIYDSPKCMEQFDINLVLLKIKTFIEKLNVNAIVETNFIKEESATL